MVARTPDPLAFTPKDRPRVAIAGDGSLAVVGDGARAVIIDLPGCAAFAEVGIDAEAASELAWVGSRPRLLVLSRYAAHTTVHLIDPHGPRTIAEIRLEAPMKLVASVGSYALAVGLVGAAVLSATDTHLTPYQFPARAMPTTAGAAGPNFVVALSGSIEEWDPATRMPRRRLRLSKPAVITAVGGSERVVWMMTQGEPARIEVIPLVNRGQPKAHDLPEPIAQVVGHPRSDLLACIGAESGRLYVVDLDGRHRMRTLGTGVIDRVASAAVMLGRTTGVLAAQANKPVAMFALEARETDGDTQVTQAPAGLAAKLAESARTTFATEPDDDDLSPPPPRSTLLDEEPDPAPAAAVPSIASKLRAWDARSALGGAGSRLRSPEGPALERPAFPRASTPSPLDARPEQDLAAPGLRPHDAQPTIERARPPTPFMRAPTPPPALPHAPAPEPPPAPGERFIGWREKMRASQARAEAAAAANEGKVTWRDDLVTWARAVAAGTVDRGAPGAPAIDALAERFDLPPPIIPALALLYGSHLGGVRGAAPFDVARVLGRRWDEALGTGLLAARGLVRYVESRVVLAPPIQRMLDDLPVATGTLVGDPGVVALLGPCVVVAVQGAPLAALAEQYLGAVNSAILAAGDDADPAELFVEARARGAAPMLRIGAGEILQVGTDPAVLVVTDDEHAEQLGVPRL